MIPLHRTLALTSALALLAACAERAPVGLPAGTWRVVLAVPGGDLPLSMEVAGDPESPDVHFINGAERVRVPEVTVDGNRVALVLTGFSNRVDATLDGETLDGTLTVIKSYGEQRIPFRAVHGETHRFFADEPARLADVAGRWAMRFTDQDGGHYKAVGEFEQDGKTVTGTILTPTGDYRFLAGEARDDRLYLSTFDGSHVYLFEAAVESNRRLAGEFWSGTAWHETWAAERDEQAALPDAMTMTFLNEGYDELDFTFPDPDGESVSLSDPEFDGKVVIVTLAGSWCPNCRDEAVFMVPFYEKNRDRGFEIIALMYEHFSEFEGAAAATRRWRDELGIEYTTLIAGVSDKIEAGKTLPMLNGVLAFPTTIFVDRAGKVRNIHTGFTGPGTGKHYETLKREFTVLVDELLAEPAPAAPAVDS
ncbi:MAG TPA: TlpA disulfide reductase family protein [Gammaproteobacteria bacterium]|nr:TlpA disulfide reductase family protein [Gammaproteobacteria bacterium]